MLARRKRLERKVRDASYKRSVRGLPCVLSGVEGAGRCSGRVDPHHVGKPGEMKMKGYAASDYTTTPHCRGHHDDAHGERGYFADRDGDWWGRYPRWALGKTAQMMAVKRAANREEG
jgi:hypothetical protein